MNVSTARRNLLNTAQQDQEDPDCGDDRVARQAVAGRVWRSANTPMHSAWCSSGNSTSSSRSSTSLATAPRSRPRTSAPMSMRRERVLVLDGVRRRSQRHGRDVAEAHVSTGRRVDQEVLDVVDAVAGRGRAPDLHVVGLAVAEDVADLLTGHDRRRGPPDVARLDAVALGLGQVDVDLDLGHVDLELHVLLDDAVDVEQHRLRPLRPSPAAPRGRGRRCARRWARSAPEITSLIRSAR